MAQKKGPPAPPSAEAREQLWEVIRSSKEPLSAAQLVKKLDAAHKMREAEAAPILQEWTEEKRLFAFPGKSAKSKPLYWDRDVVAIAREAALEAMEESDIPLTAKELVGRMRAPLKFSEKDITPRLDAFVADGTWHAIPPATAKGKPRYWNRGIADYGRVAIRQFLNAKGAQTESAIKKAAKGLDESQFRESFQKSLEEKQVWKHPPVGKSKKEVFGAEPPSPERYLQDIGKQLSQVVSRLTGAGVSTDDLRRAYVQIGESAGIPFGGMTRADRGTSTTSPVPTFDLIAQMKRIEPGALRGALVPARELRRATNLSKLEFDRAALELARQGRLSLHRHDHAASLDPAERDELVSDGNGIYYVGMALRQNTASSIDQDPTNQGQA